MNMFRTIKDVAAPLFHQDQEVTVLSRGTYVPATVTHPATLRPIKYDRKTYYVWMYSVSLTGVGVCRQEKEIRS